MWSLIARYLAKGAIWAAGHPDQVIQIVQDIKAAKKS